MLRMKKIFNFNETTYAHCYKKREIIHLQTPKRKKKPMKNFIKLISFK